MGSVDSPYSWDNRVGFVVRILYDIDNNGILNQHDFECMALKMTIIQGKGEFSNNLYQENLHIMLSLWEEIAQLADFNKDGVVTVDEFKQAVQKTCVGRPYRDFPQAMKLFIDSHFKLVDINNDGVVAIEEYRYNCINRLPIDTIDTLDEGYQNLLTDEDRKRGGITLSRFQELYAQFLGNPDENCGAAHLFGPLHSLC
ncbi:sarcoplasmic calcium-binding protein 1 [Chelonus insularis]|uniref:sarcoplasmic calcium-binding protein 1 n=1 Tax=Chelonus insularis TaxID=460826 RepID=UPI00158A0AE4|nr:sarcoplasmic calcium-binding protein 1 [Chelonus insularis]